MLSTSTNSHAFQSKSPSFQNLMTQFPPLTCHCTPGTEKTTYAVLWQVLVRLPVLGLKVTVSLPDT